MIEPRIITPKLCPLYKQRGYVYTMGMSIVLDNHCDQPPDSESYVIIALPNMGDVSAAVEYLRNNHPMNLFTVVKR